MIVLILLTLLDISFERQAHGEERADWILNHSQFPSPDVVHTMKPFDHGLGTLGAGAALYDGVYQLETNPALLGLLASLDIHGSALIDSRLRTFELGIVDGLSSRLVGGIVFRHLMSPETHGSNRYIVGLGHATQMPYPLAIGVSYDYIRLSTPYPSELPRGYHLFHIGGAIPFSQKLIVGFAYHLNEPLPSFWQVGGAVAWGEHIKSFIEWIHKTPNPALVAGVIIQGKSYLALRGSVRHTWQVRKWSAALGIDFGVERMIWEYTVAFWEPRAIWHQIGVRFRQMMFYQDNENF